MTDEKKVEEAITDDSMKINWDDTNIESLYANIGTATANREEFFLLFGTHQNWRGSSPDNTLSVKLSNRVVMSPYAAKRLAIILQRSVHAYEKQYGEISV